MNSNDIVKFIDGISFSVALGVILGAIPYIAGVFTIVWTGIQIWESKTIQSWIKRKDNQLG